MQNIVNDIETFNSLNCMQITTEHTEKKKENMPLGRMPTTQIRGKGVLSVYV
jgi:hypothetical protein